jgi:hypothetical protein
LSHEGGAHQAPPGGSSGGHAASVPGVMTFGELTVGELLAERYRLDEHVDTDAAGRQIWRGTDTVLRRPVALVLRYPGGEPAVAMLTAAVAASRLVHPHIVSVYDAIDEGERAYLVREWVPGIALRDVLQGSSLDSERATLVTHAIAEAVAALHNAGIVHGNVHPGTILIADDGRVVLTDAHADGPADDESDIRALGALLYACLTSHWPAEAGQSGLPDAIRDSSGRLASPRQVRGGIPRHLDEIAIDLLDRRAAPPQASAVAAEFARLAMQGVENGYDDEGPMGFAATEHNGNRRRAGGKLMLGVAVLAAIAVAGALAAVKVLGGAAPSQTTPGLSTSGSPGVSASAPGGTPIAIAPNQVRIVDPPKGDRAEVGGADKVVDGDEQTGWATDEYNKAFFGGAGEGKGLKRGMGILIDLGKPTAVNAVRVVVNQQGASIALRAGTSDPGASLAGAELTAADATIAKDYTTVGSPMADYNGTVMVIAVPAEQPPTQYLMVWITKLPEKAPGTFVLTINEITVLGT